MAARRPCPCRPSGPTIARVLLRYDGKVDPFEPPAWSEWLVVAGFVLALPTIGFLILLVQMLTGNAD